MYVQGTVLDVEGDLIFYYACTRCNHKVQLINDKQSPLLTSTSSPLLRNQPKLYNVFGVAANEIFGCTAFTFRKKMEEARLTEAEYIKAVKDYLIGEIVKLTVNCGNVTNVEFLNPESRPICVSLKPFRKDSCDSSPETVDAMLARKVLPLNTKQVLEKEFDAFFDSPDETDIGKNFTRNNLPGKRIAEGVDSSTPVFGGRKARSVMPGDAMLITCSPIVIGSPTDHMPKNSKSGRNSDSKIDLENAHISSSDSYSKIYQKRRKRRRCRVQCLVVDPPTFIEEPTEKPLITAPRKRELSSGNRHVIPQGVPRDHVALVPDSVLPGDTANNEDPLLTSSCETQELIKSVNAISSKVNLNIPSSQTSTESLSSSDATVDLVDMLGDFDDASRDLMEGKGMTDEIEEVATFASNTQTIETFGSETQLDSVTKLDDDLVDDLITSDDSIYQDVSGNTHVPLVPHCMSYQNILTSGLSGLENLSLDYEESHVITVGKGDSEDSADHVKKSVETVNVETKNLTRRPFPPIIAVSDDSDHDNSNEDLFGDTNSSSSSSSKRERKKKTLDWSKISQLSTQQLSKRFDFQISNSDSDQSTELF